MLLAAAERRLKLAQKLAAAIRDPRDPARVRHSLIDILHARIFAIVCGYEDANGLDRLCHDRPSSSPVRITDSRPQWLFSVASAVSMAYRRGLSADFRPAKPKRFTSNW